MRQYEAMFIFEPTFGSDPRNVEQELQRIMERAGAEIITWGKWDERKLAYEIGRNKRGLYVLAFLRVDPERTVGIERDCRLAENILRVLITRADDISRERMDRVIAESPAATRSERDAERSRAGHDPSEKTSSKAEVDVTDGGTSEKRAEVADMSAIETVDTPSVNMDEGEAT